MAPTLPDTSKIQNCPTRMNEPSLSLSKTGFSHGECGFDILPSRFGGVQVGGACGQRGDRQNFCDINPSCPHSQGAHPPGRIEGLSALNTLHHDGQEGLHRLLLHNLLFLGGLQRRKSVQEGLFNLTHSGKGVGSLVSGSSSARICTLKFKMVVLLGRIPHLSHEHGECGEKG